MNRSTKTLIVLAPGGLMGAGVGALIGAFSIDPASPAVFTLQVLGVLLWLAAVGLRVLLSEAELRLSAFAGLISNSACTFLAGASVVLGLSVLAGVDERPDVWKAVALVSLSWIPCCVIVLVGLMLTEPFRKRLAEARKD